MILADTNVLLDYYRDDVAHREALAGFSNTLADRNEALVVTEAVLVESVWALRKQYGLDRRQAGTLLLGLLSAPTLRAWDEEIAAEALTLMCDDPRLDITDCLLAARCRLKGDALVTFDRLLHKTVEESETT